jgi:hypothetical protein
MFKEGEYLKHRSKPEWGSGKIVSISGDKDRGALPSWPREAPPGYRWHDAWGCGGAAEGSRHDANAQGKNDSPQHAVYQVRDRLEPQSPVGRWSLEVVPGMLRARRNGACLLAVSRKLRRVTGPRQRGGCRGRTKPLRGMQKPRCQLRQTIAGAADSSQESSKPCVECPTFGERPNFRTRSPRALSRARFPPPD